MLKKNIVAAALVVGLLGASQVRAAGSLADLVKPATVVSVLVALQLNDRLVNPVLNPVLNRLKPYTPAFVLNFFGSSTSCSAANATASAAPALAAK